MRRAAWDQHSTACAGFHLVVAPLNSERAFHDIPRFVIMMVEVQRSDPTRRAGRRAGIAPFRNHEGIIDRTKDVACKWRCSDEAHAPI